MTGSTRGGKYPDELRQRGVRMVFEHQDEYPSQWKVIGSISKKLGVNDETLRKLVRAAEVDGGQRPGVTTEERSRIKELERENRELPPGERDPESGVGFLRGGARPPVMEMVAFIDDHRDRFGVEPICRVLTEHGCKIAPNTYWVACERPPSACAVRDAELVVEIRRVYEENLFVYGADKIWTQLNRENITVGRGRIERLMCQEGICGARWGKAFKVTATSDDRLHRPADLVAREFKAPAPDRLSVADLTYVETHTGWVYVAFIIDVYSLFIVGWQASRSLRSDLAIDALEMAVFNGRCSTR